MDWQPIETHLGDDEPVIIAFNGTVSPGHFVKDEYGEGEDGWWWFDDAETGPCEPTNWMPLPLPPIEQ